jgi:hypothetical protein
MSRFYLPVDLSHTALLLSDVQEQILKRFPPKVASAYLSNTLALVQLFRDEISRRRSL